MSLSSDEHAWLRRIEDKLDDIRMNGCSKAPQHEDHETRLRTVENQQAETRGKVIMASGVISVAAVLIGRLFK